MSTKPKKFRGVRQTVANPKKQKGKGRPQGTRLKRKFEETKVGFMLKYETPLEYDLIISSLPKTVFMQPDPDVILAVAEASDDESFKKAKFFRYLEEYRQNGILCDRPKVLTPERCKYYEKMRKNKVKTYLMGKRKLFKKLRN